MAGEHDVIKRLEREGWFERARNGDHRACGLFTRLVAFTLNPNGDPAGWGWLRKTAGGANVEGYSEDAMVLGNDANNRNNVVDIIGGAGAPGASCGMGGFVSRRSSDIWESPRALSVEQLNHLKPGHAQPQPEPQPQPQPQPQPTPQPQPQPEQMPAWARELVAKVDALQATAGEIAGLRGELEAAKRHAVIAAQTAQRIEATARGGFEGAVSTRSLFSGSASFDIKPRVLPDLPPAEA